MFFELNHVLALLCPSWHTCTQHSHNHTHTQDVDKPAWIEGHDDPNQPLTINVRWKPLVQALIESNNLMPGTKPLLPQGKVQWQLHMDD